MPLVQAWPAGNSAEQSGPVTTAGSTLFASVVVRSEDVANVDIVDDGGNTWTEVDSHTDVLMYVGLFRATNAAAISEATAVCTDASDEPVTASTSLLVEEWSGVGDEVGTSTVTTGTDGGEPDPITATAAGQTLIGVCASNVANRDWGITSTNVTPTEGEIYQGGQITHRRAYATTAAAEGVAIGWDRIEGSAASAYIVNALFEEGEGGGPGPLSVDAGADQSIYVGQSASVSATAAGGTAPYSYAWTVVSGSGSFLNSNQASTTFTPTGSAGVRVLRCIVTDANSTVAQDDLTLTVTQAPSMVGVAEVNDATGWTAIGGTVKDVLNDTSDSTGITSMDNPVDQILDVTVDPVTIQEGQHFVTRVRARRGTSATTATVTGYLYTGTTLHSTVTARPIPGSYGDVDLTFPADEIENITPAQWAAGVRVVTTVTATS